MAGQRSGVIWTRASQDRRADVRGGTFLSAIDSGAAPNRAWLARHHGLNRARVTQLMSLLLLHPDILDDVLNLPAGTPERLVTEMKLRHLVKLR